MRRLILVNAAISIMYGVGFMICASLLEDAHNRITALEAAPTRTHTCQLVDGKNRYTCRYVEIEEVR